MKKFYCLFQKIATVSPILTYSHYVELLSFENINEVKYYVVICEQNNISVRQLRERIKNKEYERLDDNTKLKLIKQEELNVEDTIKNPIMIKNTTNYEIVSEKVLQKLILEDIPAFLNA